MLNGLHTLHLEQVTQRYCFNADAAIFRLAIRGYAKMFLCYQLFPVRFFLVFVVL